MVYKDKEGHFTSKENDGGECQHDALSFGKETKKSKKQTEKENKVKQYVEDHWQELEKGKTVGELAYNLGMHVNEPYPVLMDMVANAIQEKKNKLSDEDFDDNMNLKSGKTWTETFDENDNAYLTPDEYEKVVNYAKKNDLETDAVVDDIYDKTDNQRKGIEEQVNELEQYPAGTSKEYTDKVNNAFEKAKPILEKHGIKLEDFGENPNEEEIMNKYVIEPFNKKYPYGNNKVWEKEYQPLYDAIDAVLDKNYNDWYIKNAKQPKQSAFDKGVEGVWGDMMTPKYEKQTSRGYPLEKTFKDGDGKTHVIIKRPKGDYAVGLDYDNMTGAWEQGMFGFDSLENAEKYLKKNYKVKG